MNIGTIIATLKNIIAKARGALPSRLPVGMTEFYDWADSIRNTYRMPTKDVDSINYALATMIMHLGQSVDRKPKLYFAKALNASAAKQVAGGVFHDIKTKQQEAEKAAAAAAAKAAQDKLEATASSVASRESKK